jgi:hypothetical protein
VLYLSQVCLQLLGRVSGPEAHEVCCSVSVTILDLLNVFLKLILFLFIYDMLQDPICCEFQNNLNYIVRLCQKMKRRRDKRRVGRKEGREGRRNEKK